MEMYGVPVTLRSRLAERERIPAWIWVPGWAWNQREYQRWREGMDVVSKF